MIRPGGSRAPILAAVGLAAACASSQPKMKTVEPEGVDFGMFDTIAFAGPTKLPKGYTRTELPERLVPVAREVFRSTLAEKGYRIVEQTDLADLLLVGGVGTKEKTIQNPSPVHDMGAFSTALTEMKVAKGALVVEVFERATGRPVWAGTLEALLEERPVEQEAFRDALKGLLDRFPAKTGD